MQRCSILSRLARRRLPALVAVGLAAAIAAARAQQPVGAIDSREVFSNSAPQWLRAVGQLQVPGSTYRDGRRSHLREDCSATLVTKFAGRRADVVITAWHCLEHYDDLSKPITFTLRNSHDSTVQREAYRLADGGGMHADWALLRLRTPVTAAQATALLVHPGRADPGLAISMAGYSRDGGKGAGGEQLTFDPACLITAEAPGVSDTDCLARKGASGGAVVQLSPGGTPQLCGVVSQGDSGGLSTFVPVATFRSAITRHLQ
ncbi:MAG: trypsin-like serine protease [Halieaceae bacterium]|jgi:hypothetical protein|nr:trypsin-like serine protease [Halieaceae bacterium]